MASSYIKHHKQCWGELDNYTQWREVRGKTDANGWREGDNRRPSSNVTGRIQEKSSWYVPRSSRNQEAANGTVTIFPNRRMSKPLTDSMASSFSNTMVSSLKLCERNCTSSSSTESERNSPSRSYRRSNSLQGSGGWLPVEDERWAGPSFSNSPPPSSLPLPRFTFALKNASPCHDNLAPLDRGAPHSVHSLFSEAKWTWDVAFATKDLKRLLHLDYSSSQGWDN
ncbi:hypothetical protein KP509_17G006100 [Ceratopteris richardii]|uniref:Uncharacterized protein n=1 Tax=Ceratopteris richardii TaxID=49495 RepID=A0A8T2SSI1_CERRI|nr:hypothetical protein KP509_17G006100 [Ceratopteris richardii]